MRKAKVCPRAEKDQFRLQAEQGHKILNAQRRDRRWRRRWSERPGIKDLAGHYDDGVADLVSVEGDKSWAVARNGIRAGDGI